MHSQVVTVSHPAGACLCKAIKDGVKVASSAPTVPAAPCPVRGRSASFHLLAQRFVVPAMGCQDGGCWQCGEWQGRAFVIASEHCNVKGGHICGDRQERRVDARGQGIWQGQIAAADRLERPMAGGEEASASSSPSSRLLLANDFQNIQLLAPALGFAEALPGPAVPEQRPA